jgi:ParB-like chromosome segregation protein Spo0J
MPKRQSLQSMIDSMTLEKVSPESLVGWEQNPRMHGDIEELMHSIGAFGWTTPILAQRGTNRVIAGHRRVQAALKRKLKAVPVIFFEFDDTQAAAYTVADNALAEQSKWDFSKLHEILDDLKIEGFDMDLTGLDELTIESFDKLDVLPAPTQDVPITKLKRHPSSYRTHPSDEIAHVARNLREHGFSREVIVAQDNTILSGEDIIEAAKSLGMTRVPVKRLSLEPGDPKALRLLIGESEHNHLAEVDERKLSDLLKEIAQSDEGALIGTGYDKNMVSALVLNTRSENEIRDIDEAKEWIGLPEYSEAKTPFQIVISFETIEDRDVFAGNAGITLENRNRKTVSCRWPFTEKEDPASVQWRA